MLLALYHVIRLTSDKDSERRALSEIKHRFNFLCRTASYIGEANITDL